MIRPSKKNAGVIYLDVEIQRTAPEVGGWDNLHKVGVAVAVALSAETNQLHIFTEKEIKKLSPLLQAADCVIGYNIVNFDFKVLKGYRQMSLEHVKCFDLMTDIASVTGFRLPLASLRAATLRAAPQTDGRDMIKLWKKGKIEKVIEGCCNDVLAMRSLHEYGMAHGEVFYFKADSKRRKRIKVKWTGSNHSEPVRLI